MAGNKRAEHFRKQSKEEILMHNNQKGWIENFTQMGAFWRHDGNPKRPHALLTKGGHSNGFFNGNVVVENPVCLDSVAYDITRKCDSSVVIDRVVGPAMGAIKLAHDLGRNLKALGGFMVKKVSDDKGVLWVPDRFHPLPAERIAPCEDTITTGGSILGMIEALERLGAEVLPFIFAIVNRSGLTEVNGREIIALINCPMDNWKPDEYPLCAEGSQAIRPKEDDNWSLLTAEY